MSRPKPSSTCSKYYQGGHFVQTEKRMFYMMMWIRLSNNQTVDIELFGTLEVEENSQFASNMNSQIASNMNSSATLVQLNLIKSRQIILD